MKTKKSHFKEYVVRLNRQDMRNALCLLTSVEDEVADRDAFIRARLCLEAIETSLTPAQDEIQF